MIEMIEGTEGPGRGGRGGRDPGIVDGAVDAREIRDSAAMGKVLKSNFTADAAAAMAEATD